MPIFVYVGKTWKCKLPPALPHQWEKTVLCQGEKQWKLFFIWDRVLRGRKKKWLRSDSFGLACQEIFCGCISPADKAIAKQVVVNLINYINRCIHAVLTLGGLSRWISVKYVDASLCVQAVAVLCNSPVLPEEQGRGCGWGQNAPIVSPAAAFPWPAGARS